MAITKAMKVGGAVVAALLVVLAIGLSVGLPAGRPKPGIRLEVIPMPPGSDGKDTLIHYRANDEGSVQRWTKVIDDFLQEYRTPKYENRAVCYPTQHQLEPNKVCDVSVESFGPCTDTKKYHYAQASPCVFLNAKLFDWTPDLYNTTGALPDAMPADLKNHIMSLREEERNKVWVSCEGESPADVEYVGPIQYFPTRGFPAYYYANSHVEGYISPLVAVMFERPKTGVLINIECKAWAKNIQYDRYERRGSVHFELLVDMN